jgi:hypothetical protein
MSQEPLRSSLATPNVNIPEGVAHAEPGSIPGEEIDLNANTPVDSEVTGPEVLLEEDGTAGKNACIEGDKVPLVKLQEPGVSHLHTGGSQVPHLTIVTIATTYLRGC